MNPRLEVTAATLIVTGRVIGRFLPESTALRTGKFGLTGETKLHSGK